MIFDDSKQIMEIRTGRGWNFQAVLEVPENSPLDLEQENGNLRIERHSGPVRAAIINGDAFVDVSEGPVHLNIENGNADIIGSSAGDFVDIDNGEAEIRDSGAQVTVRVDNGGIIFSPTRIPESQCISARAGNGKTQVLRSWRLCSSSSVRLEVQNGDITIR